ncbi:MAG TPA: PAS domain S-box protein [Pedobacter sp.]
MLAINEATSVHSSLLRVIESRNSDVQPVFTYELINPESGAPEILYWSNTNEPIVDETGQVAYIIHTTINITAQILQQQPLHNAEEQIRGLENEQALREELTSANEELMAINEELQQTQENLQSLNEEFEERVLQRTLELSESEKRFRTMAEDTDVLIAVGDETGGAVYFNRAWSELTGRSMEDLLKFGWVDLMHPEDQERVMKIFMDAFEQKKSWEWEFRMPDKKGGYSWLLARGTPRFRADGSFAGYISSTVDITERKQIEEEREHHITALQAANARLEEIADPTKYRKALLEAQNEAIPDALLIVDTQGQMLSFNHHFINLWGIPEEIIKRKDDTAALQHAMTQLVDPQGFIERVNYCYAHPNEVAHEDVQFKDGRTIERFGTSVMGDDGTYYGWAWHFRDITKKREMQKQKDEFISTVSHELKTPVASIKAYAQLLKRALAGIQNLDIPKGFLERMNKQISHLESLIKDILDISRIEAGKLDLKEEEFDISDVLNELISDLQVFTTTHSLNIKNNHRVTIKADKNRIIQAISNLVMNAVKYSSNSEAVEISSNVKDKFLIFSVTDFGIGIAEHQKQFLFDRFHQIERSNTGTGFNLGLGLYISKEIINRGGGELWLESKLGEGSTFSFSLPLY